MKSVLVLLAVLGQLISASPLSTTSLLDYDPARNDDPSKLGKLNLETTNQPKTYLPSNTPDLYIKPGVDSKGMKVLHCHRGKELIRAEYHTLSGKIKKDQTYYIGYSFSVANIDKTGLVFQFKEYENTKASNIPVSLLVQDGKLHFQVYRDGVKRVTQWETPVVANQRYKVGIVINTAESGWVEFHFEGQQQKLGINGAEKVSRLPALTFPGRAEPKFGTYSHAAAVELDTYIYRIQVGTRVEDIKAASGIA